ncbi:unnamed protein product, partial [Mesorhabditis spiculigera]
MITFASSTSDSKVTRDILYSRRNISLYPDDPKIAAIIGYESIFQKTAILLIAWILFPVFPGYCLSIYYRTQILKILNENALTIQAILPIAMMSQCSMFFWRQFQLPYGEKAPYFEEAPFLLLAMVSACNPVITMYYVLPYRRRVVEMIGFWRRSSAKVQLYDITFAASTSTTEATRELLVSGRNISLFPDDPNIAAMLGYESIFQGTTMVLIVWILFPVFPGYCLSIYSRTKIMHILNDNTSAMSNSTKRAQHDLIKALTIQAVLPVVMMSQCSVYFWRQFQLPFGDKAPYFEEAPFLLLAMVSAFSPAITIYYLLPYRKRVVEIVIFWKKFARTRIYDHSTHSTTKEKHSNGTIHINSMF